MAASSMAWTISLTSSSSTRSRPEDHHPKEAREAGLPRSSEQRRAGVPRGRNTVHPEPKLQAYELKIGAARRQRIRSDDRRR